MRSRLDSREQKRRGQLFSFSFGNPLERVVGYHRMESLQINQKERPKDLQKD
jgi:hypothetical protein